MKIELDGNFIAEAATQTIRQAIESALTDSWGVQSEIKKAITAAFETAQVPARIGAKILELLTPTIDGHVEAIALEMLPSMKAGARLLAQEVVVSSLARLTAGAYESTAESQQRVKATRELVAEYMVKEAGDVIESEQG